MTDTWQWRRLGGAALSLHARVALIPGLGTTARLWEGVVAELPSDIEAVVGELPGHGKQAPAVGVGIQELAEHALHALPAGEVPTIVVGHSMGGAVAMEMANASPDRLAGVVLVCSSDRFGDAEGWRAHMDGVRASGLQSIAPQAPAGWFRQEFIDQNSAVVAQFVRDLTDVDAASYLACCAALADYEGRGTLSGIRTPTILIGAADDAGTPVAHMRRMAQSIAGSAFTLSIGAHLAPVEAPSVIAAAVEQLLSAPPARRSPTTQEAS